MFNKSKKDTPKNKDVNTKAATKKKQRIPKNVLDSIPYKSIYPNGIIQDYDNWYSRSYYLSDVNFATENEDKKVSMFLDYCKLLNTISPDMRAQLLIYNRTIDEDTIRNEILMKPSSDNRNHLRDEWNEEFLKKMQQGRNNLKKEKIFTISTYADNIAYANDKLNNINGEIQKNIRQITKQDTSVMKIEDRLSIMYDIYNYNNNLPFSKKIKPISEGGTIDWNDLARKGISSKDLIAPDSMEFCSNYFRLGDNYGKAFFIDSLPATLNTSFLDNISNLSCNMLLSVTFEPLEQSQVTKMIKNQDTAINAEIISLQKRNQGQYMDYIPTELERAKDQTKDLLHDIMTRDQKIFKVTLLVILLSESMESLNQYESSLRSITTGYLCQLRTLRHQEELSLNTALPLAEMHVPLDRMLTTESAGVFIPFTVHELYHRQGLYYGLNAISKNMIRYDRKTASNYNGLVLGKSGSGKSFIVKEEIMQRLLTTDDKVIIIDPEGEYTKIGEAFGGTIIKIDNTNRYRINPLDMDINYAGNNENPIVMKIDYVISLVETMLGGDGMLEGEAKNALTKATKAIYMNYYNYISENKGQTGMTCKKEEMPTLYDLYERLTKGGAVAQALANGIESYCVGAYNNFASRTNVDTNNRLIIYDVKDMGSSMKEVAMQVCMNDAWNHIIANSRTKHYTALYIDEFHLFTKTRTSAKFMQNIYKRARKWKGIPTAITQNIGDLFVNEESTALVNNCDFILMMNQSPTDREILADMYQISTELQEYIKDRGFGIGLLYNGKTVVPFENSFDNFEAESFKIMDSRTTNTVAEKK